MKKQFYIYMSKDGNAYSSGVGVYVYAETEFEAIKEAQKRHPDLKVAKISIK